VPVMSETVKAIQTVRSLVMDGVDIVSRLIPNYCLLISNTTTGSVLFLSSAFSAANGICDNDQGQLMSRTDTCTIR